MRVLLIEDEQEIVQAIRRCLKQSYIIDAAYNGKIGTHLAEVCQYDLILLDLNLPDTTGTEVCRAIRSHRVKTPILILTGQDTVDQKVATLDAGADDYLTKPFDLNELNARMRALLRRNPDTLLSNIITVSDLALDPIKRQVIRDGKAIKLRKKEFDLLEYMMRNQGKVLRRDMILEHVWDDENDAFTNIVDVHIKYLRDQIDKPFARPLIKTVHGIGYKLEE